jgi:hypothetical protein
LNKNNLTYIDFEKKIEEINSDSTFNALNDLKEGRKVSKAGVFIHAKLDIITGLIFNKSRNPQYSRLFNAFFNMFGDFLTRLKLLKLQNKI